jgi:hypothetical protein
VFREPCKQRVHCHWHLSQSDSANAIHAKFFNRFSRHNACVCLFLWCCVLGACQFMDSLDSCVGLVNPRVRNHAIVHVSASTHHWWLCPVVFCRHCFGYQKKIIKSKNKLAVRGCFIFSHQNSFIMLFNNNSPPVQPGVQSNDFTSAQLVLWSGGVASFCFACFCTVLVSSVCVPYVKHFTTNIGIIMFAFVLFFGLAYVFRASLFALFVLSFAFFMCLGSILPLLTFPLQIIVDLFALLFLVGVFFAFLENIFASKLIS